MTNGCTHFAFTAGFRGRIHGYEYEIGFFDSCFDVRREEKILVAATENDFIETRLQNNHTHSSALEVRYNIISVLIMAGYEGKFFSEGFL